MEGSVIAITRISKMLSTAGYGTFIGNFCTSNVAKSGVTVKNSNSAVVQSSKSAIRDIFASNTKAKAIASKDT